MAATNKRQKPMCEICGSERPLDFHHWDYDNDIGIEICRECHNSIHGGEGGRVKIQQNRAEYYGGEYWWERAIPNLIRLDLQNGGFSESDAEYCRHRDHDKAEREWGLYADYLSDKYKIPRWWLEYVGMTPHFREEASHPRHKSNE